MFQVKLIIIQSSCSSEWISMYMYIKGYFANKREKREMSKCKAVSTPALAHSFEAYSYLSLVSLLTNIRKNFSSIIIYD